MVLLEVTKVSVPPEGVIVKSYCLPAVSGATLQLPAVAVSGAAARITVQVPLDADALSPEIGS